MQGIVGAMVAMAGTFRGEWDERIGEPSRRVVRMEVVLWVFAKQLDLFTRMSPANLPLHIPQTGLPFSPPSTPLSPGCSSRE